VSQIKLIYEELRNLHQELHDMKFLLIKEREDIVSFNLKGLGERQTRIEELFERIRSMSEKIAAEIADACEKNGAPGETMLSSLISKLSQSDGDKLALLRAEIHKTSAEVDNALKVNRGILEDSVALTSQSMDFFTGMLKNSSTYGQAGRFVETVDRSRIINREI
jgi:hypothetical protein